MEQETTQTLIELLKEVLSRPDSTVMSAYITIGGMFGVAAITSLTQWLVTKSVIRSEHERLKTQLQSDFKLNQFSKWQDEFVAVISDLLGNTDPEAYPEPDRKRVIPLIQKSQLLLNLDIQSHRKVNGLVNELALVVNKWEHGTPKDILGIQGRLLEASRDAIYLPGR